MKNDNYTIVLLLIIIAILGLILFLKSNGALSFKTNSEITKQETSTVVKTDIEISSIKERISMIATTLGMGNEISSEETYRKLINVELSKNTTFQIDENFDITQMFKKISNKNGKILHVKINTTGNITVSFNM